MTKPARLRTAVAGSCFGNRIRMGHNPFGILADHVDRRLQLASGTLVLVAADAILASTSTVWLTAMGAALWGSQLGVTQGLLGATVADVAPDHLRGTAFGIFDIAVGAGTFIASASAGALWTMGGPAAAFGISACVATAAVIMLAMRAENWPIRKSVGKRGGV